MTKANIFFTATDYAAWEGLGVDLSGLLDCITKDGWLSPTDPTRGIFIEPIAEVPHKAAGLRIVQATRRLGVEETFVPNTVDFSLILTNGERSIDGAPSMRLKDVFARTGEHMGTGILAAALRGMEYCGAGKLWVNPGMEGFDFWCRRGAKIYAVFGEMSDKNVGIIQQRTIAILEQAHDGTHKLAHRNNDGTFVSCTPEDVEIIQSLARAADKSGIPFERMAASEIYIIGPEGSTRLCKRLFHEIEPGYCIYDIKEPWTVERLNTMGVYDLTTHSASRAATATTPISAAQPR